jgi:DNA-binding MarR family transcriptional regulator
MTRHPQEASEAPLLQQVATGLAKIGLALKGHAWREAGPRGLTPTQTQILALLKAAPRPMRISAVAEGLGVTLPTASDAVRVLVEKGLVAKTRAPDDRRAVALALTPRGRREIGRVSAWPDVLLEAVRELTLEEQAIFLKSLVKVIRTLQERGEIPVARMCVSCRFFRPNAHPEDAERPHHCAFVDAPFGDRALRIECPEHESAPRGVEERNWHELVAARAGRGDAETTPSP